MTHSRSFDPARRNASLKLLALGACAAAGVVRAQETYPDRLIRFTVPQPAGGTGDMVTRLVAQRLESRLGKTVMVENRAGAGGTLGARAVAKSPADGYSLVLASPGFATFTSMYANLNFDPATDFTPVGMMGIVPVTVLVRDEAPFKTLRDFVAWARTHAGEATYASAGQGSLSHLTGAWFAKEAGLDITHVPYSGTAPALTALVGGQVGILFDSGAGSELLKAGRVRALATANPKRVPGMPSVPTLNELGYPVRGAVWLGVMTTAGTPAPIVERLSRELLGVMKEPEVRQQLESRGVYAEPMPAAQFAAFFANETRIWSKLVRDNGIRAE
jgi:tripartite-type tricarboxylate transporter receptor subunit TctC